jgi:hypothetical protein
MVNRMKTSILNRVVGLVAIAGFALMAVPSTTKADPVVSNLSQPFDGFGDIKFTAWAAFGFNTGSSAYTIDSVTLPIAPNGSELLNNLIVQLYSSAPQDTTIAPSALLASFTYNSGNNYVFSTGSDVLEASTDYWVIVGATGSDFYKWDYTNTGASTAGSGTIFGGWSDSNDQGVTWTTAVVANAPYKAEIQATAVPEPSTYAMLGIGIAMLAVLRLRRRAV